MTMEQQVAQLESLCESMYSGQSNTERNQASQALVGFYTNVECLAQCRMLIQYSTNAAALLFAGASITRLVTNYWNNITTEQALDLRAFVLEYLTVSSLLQYLLTPDIEGRSLYSCVCVELVSCRSLSYY